MHQQLLLCTYKWVSNTAGVSFPSVARPWPWIMRITWYRQVGATGPSGAFCGACAMPREVHDARGDARADPRRLTLPRPAVWPPLAAKSRAPVVRPHWSLQLRCRKRANATKRPIGSLQRQAVIARDFFNVLMPSVPPRPSVVPSVLKATCTVSRRPYTRVRVECG